MDPTTWAALILVGGACVLALAGIVTVRTAAKWPELSARLASVEIQAREALELATKARRIASTRATKDERRARKVDPLAEIETTRQVPDAPPDLRLVGGRPWIPGAPAHGSGPPMAPGYAPGGAPPAPAPADNGEPTPVGFVADEPEPRE